LSTVKVVELVGESGKSWEDAVNNAVEEASKTIDYIEDVEVANMRARVDNGKISEYKVDLHVSFPVVNK
jgi:dodecin